MYPDPQWNNAALVVVDMQRYYLEPDSPFAQYHEHCEPGCLDYIHQRCGGTVIPNCQRLLARFRELALPVFYLRLCGAEPDRSDIHITFRNAHQRAEEAGFPGLYPVVSDPLSEVAPAISPQANDDVVIKTTFSAFTSADFEARLRQRDLHTLVFAGLATSQCVETTARDAADRGFVIVHAEDAQADYSEMTHRASLYSSHGVCGGRVVETGLIMDWLDS